MILLLISFLKTNWLPVLLVVLGLFLFGRYETVRIERDHYKQEAVTAQATIVKLKAQIEQTNKENAERQAIADKLAKDLTEKYKDALIQKNQAIEVNNSLVEKQIAQDKELHRVKLSYNALRLFNASKSVSQASTEAATTKQSNDATSSPSGEATSQVTLADLYTVSAHNDANHMRCIEKVKQWQKFWTEFSTQYNAQFDHAT